MLAEFRPSALDSQDRGNDRRSEPPADSTASAVTSSGRLSRRLPTRLYAKISKVSPKLLSVVSETRPARLSNWSRNGCCRSADLGVPTGVRRVGRSLSPLGRVRGLMGLRPWFYIFTKTTFFLWDSSSKAVRA